jgi:short-subunit dehydrogenase
VTGQKALVTGASRGIGKAIAIALREAGCQVIGTSRHPETIRDKIEGIEYLRLELLDDRSIEDCVSQISPIDILISNAGGSHIWPAAEAPLEKVKEQFQLNLFGPIKLAQGFLPSMIRRKKGFILIIGSLAGRFSIPFQSSYTASKLALAGFAWALRNEVKTYGIKVVTLEPNHIRTAIKPEILLSPDSAFQDEMAKVIRWREKNVDRGSSTDIVAKKAVQILKKRNPRPFYAVGGSGPLLLFLKRILPDKSIEEKVRKNLGL